MQKILMSGMRPTGKLHMGHYMGVLENWVKLQENFDCFFAVADLHALTTKYDKTENLRQDIFEVVVDWLASGIDPEKSKIFVQSHIPSVSRLHVLLSMVTPQNWVERDPTLKDMAKILRNKDEATSSVSYGLMGYPVLMTTDILGINAEVVPVGIDQVAHIEITRDIAKRFNYLYETDFFVEPQPLLTQTPLLLGVDGQKMGKSFQNDIKISDSEEETTKKIMKCITDTNRIKRTDKGSVENCLVAFKYYKTFASDCIETVEKGCSEGTLGCVDCKRQLAQIINQKFEKIREKRNYWQNNPKLVREIVNEGTKKANAKYQEVYDKVCEIMKLYI